MTSEDDPFHDCELDPEAILGTHTFEDVLFTDDTETPVNVLTGETPAHSQATVEEAKEFAEYRHGNTPNRAPRIRRVAGRNTEQALHSAAAFFHFKATGSLKRRHRAYHAAYESDGFAVDFEADYESGDLTITVGRADEA